MKFHNLSGQNLLRHNEIQKLIGKRATLISDSISFYELTKIIFSFSYLKFVIHALELYSVSYGACLSEYRYRWSIVKDKKILLLKSFVGCMAALLRVYFLRRIAASSKLIIISSEMRRQYLIDEGVNFSIAVVKNKPIFDPNLRKSTIIRDASCIVLIGNMYSAKEDFLKVVNIALNNNMDIYCYGLSSADELWLKNMSFTNVKIFKRVSNEDVTQILQSSKYSLCLYSNLSINNEYSASSKVFELLYYGVTPIISNNLGLKNELDSLEANYVQIDDYFYSAAWDLENNSLTYSDVCQFGYELNLLDDFLVNFY